VEDSRKADAVERLIVLLNSQDGFAIAEEDLRIRGAGDFLGTRQSGLPRLHFADLVRDGDLVLAARDLVRDHPRPASR
jgi:ATP-dependent DNA helicase RecG